MATDRQAERDAERSATERPERGPDQAGAAVHSHRRFSWVVVSVLTLAAVLLGVAFVAQSLLLAIVAAVIGVIGVVGLIAGGVMDDAY